MIRHRHFIALLAGAGILIGALVVGLIEPRGPDALPIGVLVGTMFGQVIVASSWNALGPGRLIWRLPLSVAWVTLITLAFGGSLAVRGGPPSVLLILAACFFGEWLVIQVILWSFVQATGWRLTHRDQAKQAADNRQWQFQIGQLLIFTTIVAVLFGIGRVVVATLFASGAPGGGNVVGISFLAIAAVVIALPLVLASLLPRYAVAATIGAAILIALATVAEGPLLKMVESNPGDLTQIALLGVINAATAAWILAFAVLVRLGGYRLAGKPALGLKA